MQGQDEKETAAHTDFGAVVQFATHQLHQLVTQRQTQPNACFVFGRKVSGQS